MYKSIFFTQICVALQDYGCQEDMVFCGIFDGHGPWGHMVSKHVRKSLPAQLLTNWQRNLSMEADQNLLPSKIWKHSCLKTYAAIDEELKQHPRIDSFYSGTTALTVVKQVTVGSWLSLLVDQCETLGMFIYAIVFWFYETESQGRHLVVANAGDSRAVLAVTSDDGCLHPVQLSVDFRPNLPG